MPPAKKKTEVVQPLQNNTGVTLRDANGHLITFSNRSVVSKRPIRSSLLRRKVKNTRVHIAMLGHERRQLTEAQLETIEKEAVEWCIKKHPKHAPKSWRALFVKPDPVQVNGVLETLGEGALEALSETHFLQFKPGADKAAKIAALAANVDVQYWAMRQTHHKPAEAALKPADASPAPEPE